MIGSPPGALERAAFGSGEPVTVFAHGLGHSIASTRPFASGVQGRRVFFQFRGHGASAAPAGEWTYDDLAAELRAVADEYGADRALGVSMGAGALCALWANDPHRFARAVLVLPAVADEPRGVELIGRGDAVADLIEARDAEGLARALIAQQAAAPAAADAVRQWADEQARWLLRGPATAFRRIPRLVALPDLAALEAVRVPVAVIAAEGDPSHPVAVARAIASTLPDGRLTVLPPGGLVWAHRATLRRLIAEFLNST